MQVFTSLQVVEEVGFDKVDLTLEDSGSFFTYHTSDKLVLPADSFPLIIPLAGGKRVW